MFLPRPGPNHNLEEIPNLDNYIYKRYKCKLCGMVVEDWGFPLGTLVTGLPGWCYKKCKPGTKNWATVSCEDYIMISALE